MFCVFANLFHRTKKYSLPEDKQMLLLRTGGALIHRLFVTKRS